MKRLLAYLFIVLGLGLVFSVNVEAKNPIRMQIRENTFKPNIFLIQIICSKCTYRHNGTIISKKDDPILYQAISSKKKKH